MGQESGKAVWPRPAGGYQTLTGRRYGRRHAYVSFRPSIGKPGKHDEQQWERMEPNSVTKDNAASEILSTNELPLQRSGYDQTMDPKKDEDFEPQRENGFLSSPLNQRLAQCESNEFVSSSATEPSGYLDSQNAEHSKWSIPSDIFETTSENQVGIGLVNMDSYESESSEGEDEDSATHPCLLKEGKLQKRLDTMLSELEKGVDYLNGLQSYLSAVIHDGSNQQVEPPCSVAMDNLPDMNFAFKENQSELKEHQKPLPTVENVEEMNGYVKMEEIKEQTERNLDNNSLGVQAEGNIFCCMLEQPSSSEMVVRPKIRKQRTDSNSVRDLHSPDDTYSHCTKEMESNTGCCGSNIALWNCMDKIHNDLKLGSGSNVKGTTGIHIEQATNQQEDPDDATDNSFWDDFENDCTIGEESSSLSSGEEWSALWTSDFVLEKMHSSDESWETLSGGDEQPTEPNSMSSSLDEDAFEHCFTIGEPTLEEGEIPWVAFNEESDSTSTSSSSTDETEGLDQLGQSGLLILNDSNNFEDYSSISEDLDMEWRLLDELGEGLTAQAISSVSPQLLSFMALEERLAQAMEAALAHLESLAIDGEQAPPPASNETIECLPQVPITEEHNGLEQSCAICCSEYVKEDLVTELPCHHIFHRPCVTLWLQKSGTCPVCRHILTSTLPEAAAAAATFLPEPATPPPTRDGPTIR